MILGKRKLFVLIWSLLITSSFIVRTTYASQLHQVQQQRNQLQNQIVQTQGKVQQQEKTATIAKSNVIQTQGSISELTYEININTIHIRQIRTELSALDAKIKRDKTQLNHDKLQLEALLRVNYEVGQVPYLAVLLNATSFDDLVSRIQTLYLFVLSEHKLLNQTLSLQKTLSTEQMSQKRDVLQLTQKSQHLFTLKREKSLQEQQAKHLWMAATTEAVTLNHQRQILERKLKITKSQIQVLEAQARQQASILQVHSGKSFVVIPSLRYQNISPTVLYDFVHGRNSAFSLADVQTICNVAKSYDVNPALMMAITGQELDFVQKGTPYETWKLENPFDVFGSWALYHTTIGESASYAAEILQVKLSLTPPNGEDPILWINDPNNHTGNGVYATNTAWAVGVKTLFDEIEAYATSH